MNAKENAALCRKLQENAAKQKKIRIDAEIDRLRHEIDGFETKYQLLGAETSEKIATVLSHIDISSGKAPNASHPVSHGKMYLCFMCGSAELLELYLCGDYADFMRDLDDFMMFSPYLLLLDADFSHFIYIRDDGRQRPHEMI